MSFHPSKDHSALPPVEEKELSEPNQDREEVGKAVGDDSALLMEYQDLSPFPAMNSSVEPASQGYYDEQMRRFAGRTTNRLTGHHGVEGEWTLDQKMIVSSERNTVERFEIQKLYSP